MVKKTRIIRADIQIWEENAWKNKKLLEEINANAKRGTKMLREMRKKK